MAKTKSDATDAPAMSKMDAARAAIRGGAAMPQAGAAHVKERYGIDISPNVFSSHKTKVMQELAAEAGSPAPEPEPEPARQANAVKPDAPKAEARPPALKPEAKAPPVPKAAPAPKPPTSTGSPADLARQVKQLVEQYGAGSVREMADVFEG